MRGKATAGEILGGNGDDLEQKRKEQKAGRAGEQRRQNAKGKWGKREKTAGKKTVRELGMLCWHAAG